MQDIDITLNSKDLERYLQRMSLIESLSPYYDELKLLRKIEDLSIRVRVKSRWVPCNLFENVLEVASYRWIISDSLKNLVNPKGIKLFGVCPFVLTVTGNEFSQITSDKYVNHTIKSFFAEAAACWLSSQYPVISVRPAFGYNAISDHKYKKDVFDILNVDWAQLTETCGIIPETSICGLIIPSNATEL